MIKRAVAVDDPDLEDDDDEDQVMNIGKMSKKKKKKSKKRKGGKGETGDGNNQDENVKEPAAKRVHFDLSQNKVTEFFKHGKVAQRALEGEGPRKKSL